MQGETLTVPSGSVQPFKDKNFALGFHRLMVRARVLEERLVKMSKSGDGFFWIGGPGEEAFSITLGLLADKGEGLEHDYLHLHYRSNGVALAMGRPVSDALRQMRSVSTDPYTGGRNFVGHICYKPFNIVPVTSTIGTQFAVAPGTAWAQRRQRLQGKKAGVTIVVGGDAGTAEGEFASCLLWSSRAGSEVPLLMIVTNNKFGISTPAQTQWSSDRVITDRAKAHGIQTAQVDGNNPEKAWAAIADALEYVRSTGKPFLLEALVSRLHGHSSSSGGNRVQDEADCIELFEKKLIKQGWVKAEQLLEVWEAERGSVSMALEQVRKEPWPDPGTYLDHSFAGGERGGVPGRDGGDA